MLVSREKLAYALMMMICVNEQGFLGMVTGATCAVVSYDGTFNSYPANVENKVSS